MTLERYYERLMQFVTQLAMESGGNWMTWRFWLEENGKDKGLSDKKLTSNDKLAIWKVQENCNKKYENSFKL